MESDPTPVVTRLRGRATFAAILGGLPIGMTIVFVVVHAAVVINTQWDIHRGLGTSAYDIGLYDQGIWLLSRLEAPFVTLMGRNLFGDHSSLILLFLVPLYWIVPGSETLLAVQAVVVSAGAIPVWWFARRRLGNDWLALLIAVVWLVNPALNGGGAENFHPDSFLALLFPLALVAALSEKWRLYWVAVVLCLLVKEDVVLVMVPLAAMLALKGQRRRAAITASMSIVATLLAMFVLMRSLIGVPTRNAWRIPFGGVGGFLKEVITNPGNVIDYLSSEDRPLYWWKMLAPLAFVSLLAPEVALVSLLVMATNTLSTFWYQFHIEYHYSVVAVPALVLAVVVGAARLNGRARHVVVIAVAVTSLVASWHWSYLPFRAHPSRYWGAEHPIASQGRAILRDLPDDAIVSVYHALAPHVAHRRSIYQFPTPFRTVLYGPNDDLEGTRLPVADDIEYVVLPRYMETENRKDWDRIKDGFREYSGNQFWQIFIRSDLFDEPG